MKSLVREKSFYKTFFSMTGIIALQNLVVFSVNLADNVMLTHWSAEALAGVALVNQIQFLLQMLMQGIGEGALVEDSVVIISYAGCSINEIEMVKKEMGKYVKFKRVIVQKASFSSACTAGVGTIGISYFRKDM